MSDESPLNLLIEGLADYNDPQQIESDNEAEWQELLKDLEKDARKRRKELRELWDRGLVRVAEVFKTDEWFSASKVAEDWGDGLDLFGEFLLTANVPIYVNLVESRGGIFRIPCPVEFVRDGGLASPLCLLRRDDVAFCEKLGRGNQALHSKMAYWLTSDEICKWFKIRVYQLADLVQAEHLTPYSWADHVGVCPAQGEGRDITRNKILFRTDEVWRFLEMDAEADTPNVRPHRRKRGNWLEYLKVRFEAMEHWAQNPATPTNVLAERDLGIEEERSPRTIERWIGDLKPTPGTGRPLGSRNKKPRTRRTAR